MNARWRLCERCSVMIRVSKELVHKPFYVSWTLYASEQRSNILHGL